MTQPYTTAGTPLNIRGISKQYGGRSVLSQIDLQAESGQFIAVVGRSGCGKSTFLRLLAGLETADGGQLLSGSQPLHERQQDTRLMFQEARLLPWKTVLQNVGLGLTGQWQQAASEALDAVGLAHRANDWPSALSGGQKQRVALARALIHRPKLLLLDEPLGALDALTRIEMQALIESLWQTHGFTVVLVTHDVSEAVTLADRVILIDEGRITLDQVIDVPRPRRPGNPRLGELEATVLNHILTPVASREQDPTLRRTA